MSNVEITMFVELKNISTIVTWFCALMRHTTVRTIQLLLVISTIQSVKHHITIYTKKSLKKICSKHKVTGSQ